MTFSQPTNLFPSRSPSSSAPGQSVLPAPFAGASFPRSSNLLSSDSDSESSTDALIFSTTRKRRTPKTVAGSKTSFILGDKLGEGAYAVVKEGIDESSLRIVAVKILDMRRLRRVRGGQDAIEREVSVQKRLKRHPNLVELIDVIRVPQRSKMYIILEMANGCTVQELVDSAPNKQLPESQVANFAHQVLVGLQYMHGKGVVHRDIKPSNMMLSATGALKISDFGVAEFLNEYNSEDNVTRTSGSPAFQAPEIAKGELGYSGMKVDVWALGVSIYLLVSGRVPFDGETLLGLFERIGTGEYTAPSNVSDECVDVISRMLTLSWKDRASVDQLLRHPWVVRGGADVSPEARDGRNWIEVPKKQFGILDVVKRMYITDEDEHTGATSPTPSPTLPSMTDSRRTTERSTAHNIDEQHSASCSIA